MLGTLVVQLYRLWVMIIQRTTIMIAPDSVVRHTPLGSVQIQSWELKDQQPYTVTGLHVIDLVWLFFLELELQLPQASKRYKLRIPTSSLHIISSDLAPLLVSYLSLIWLLPSLPIPSTFRLANDYKWYSHYLNQTYTPWIWALRLTRLSHTTADACILTFWHELFLSGYW